MIQRVVGKRKSDKKVIEGQLIIIDIKGVQLYSILPYPFHLDSKTNILDIFTDNRIDKESILYLITENGN